VKRALLAAMLLAAMAVTARSYVYENFGGSPVRWPNAQATVHHDPKTITGSYVSELAAALAVWSNVSGSAFRFTHGGASSAANVRDSQNGSTDIYFDNSLPPYGYAVTMVNTPYTGADITERDVAFNGNVTWTTSATNQAGGPVDFRTVAIHELGHVLGLLHETTNSSVMNVTGWDPAFARHSLTADDRNAVVFLYPGTGPGPNAFADLLIRSIDVTPLSAGPGDAVELTYEMQNAGTTGTGGFTAGAYLTGRLVPVAADPFVGSAAEGDLASGEFRSGRILGVVPTNLRPGKYRFGVLLDSEGVVGERNEANNGGASGAPLVITRPPIEVGPGQIVTSRLGPKGEDTFTVVLPEGTTLKLRGKVSVGNVTLTATAEGESSHLLEAGPGRKAKGKFRSPAEGTYVIRIAGTSTADSDYELRIRAKALKTKGTGDTDDEIRIPIRVYRGCIVTAVVRGKGGFAPTAEFEGLVAPEKIGRGRVKLGPFTAEENGVLTLIVRAPAGTEGTAKWSVRVKPPKQGLLITR